MTKYSPRRRLLLAFVIAFLTCPAMAYGQDAASGQGERSSEGQAPSTGILVTVQEKINAAANFVVENVFLPTLFYGIPTGVAELDRYTAPDVAQTEAVVKIPLVLLVLISGALFFSFRFGFVNLRLFRHSLDVIAGKYDKHDDRGEVTHFQALTSALSATVGLGNIASVAVAVSLGGAGAVFWMWMVGFFGMCSKFSSCTLAQLYRRVKPDGSVLGGPMIYLQDGLKERVPALAPLGKVLATMYAVFTMFAAFGGGNMFQGNQTFSMLRSQFDVIEQRHGLIFGVLLAILVGAVIIGGIRRIGRVTSKLVPLMCLFYSLVCLTIVVMQWRAVPGILHDIFTEAFHPDALYGGMMGVLILGAKRAAFSNEAGMGSAAIAHAAAKTDEPVREGIVAMIGPFIDTIVVCTMTALAILVTGAHLDASGEPMTMADANSRGVEVTAAAFGELGSLLPYFLCLAVFVFAYSTMISWCYYGERATEYLFGEHRIRHYRIVYVVFVVLGPVLSLQAVIDFSDMMLISMAFPNIIGSVILSGLVASRLRDYVHRLKSGAMRPVG